MPALSLKYSSGLKCKGWDVATVMKEIRRFGLSRFPTPLEPMLQLSKKLGGPEIWVKRDDLTSLAMGGNKTRKLEYLVADALSCGADTLITAGSIQSNHCRQTAAAAVRANMGCHLVLSGEPPADGGVQGNHLIDLIMGASLHWTDRNSRDAMMLTITEECRSQGLKPYIIPVGGSNGVGALGYVNALKELNVQSEQLEINFDRIVFASSSGGTQAGLQLGAELTGFSGRITGISVDQDKLQADSFTSHMAKIAGEAATILGVDSRINPGSFELNTNYIGSGYAVMGELERRAIHLAARTEALLVGPVYTARALGGLIDLVEKSVLLSKERILFWHTGDTPTIFAYAKELA